MMPVEDSSTLTEYRGQQTVLSSARDISERKRAEEWLGLQSAALVAAANAIVITNRAGYIIWVNPAFTRLTGYTSEEALAHNPRMLKSGVHGPAFYRNLWETILAGQVWHGEVVNRRKDGALYTEEMTITPVRDEHGEITHFIAIKQDVTARKQAEAEIARRNAELAARNAIAATISQSLDLNTILETALDRVLAMRSMEAGGIYLLETDSTTLGLRVHRGISEQSRQATQYLRMGERTLGQAIAERRPVVLNMADFSQEPLVSVVDREGLQSAVAVPLTSKGAVLGMLMLGARRPQLFPQEEMDLLAAIGQQIGVAVENARLYEQVKAQHREAIQQKQYAETVLRSIADGVYSVDLAGIVLTWSQGAEAITGHTAREAIGRSCADFLRHTDENSHALCNTDRCPFYRIWAEGKLTTPEQVFAHHKDGRMIPVAITVAPICDETGQRVGAVEVFRDVSKERELVTNLQAASRAKTRFLANMSHELRTPLNGILGISQALQQGVYGELNPKQAARLGNVYESGQHLLRLINDLLDVARVEEGRLALEVQSISVPDLCRTAVQMIQPVADARQISLELKLEPGLAVIEGDERRLRQVLLNLLSNAVKFTSEQGRVGLTAREQADGVEFVVWDTGIGIAVERQALLFQPFSQVDDDLARRYQGTGLGLALVKQLTELHGGWVAVESQPGRGSRFRVWLPTKRPTLDAAHPAPDARRSTPSAERSSGHEWNHSDRR